MSAHPPQTGRVWRFGDNLNTDVLAPGQYMKFGIEEIARHCLEAVEPRFAKEVQAGDVLVAGRNCGAGSSREQAPQALKHLGVAALVAESFAGLFCRNALNLGLPALVCAEAKRIRANAEVTSERLKTEDRRAMLPARPVHLHVRRRYLRRPASSAMPTKTIATASMTMPTRMSMAITSRFGQYGALFVDGPSRYRSSSAPL